MSVNDNEYEVVNFSPLSEDAIYDENEISLPTLFKDHLNDLPMLCIIAEGIYGPTSYNGVCSGQLLWMHTHSTQERVIVRETCNDKHVPRQCLSIPLDFLGKFRIVYNRFKKGPERTLRDIIKESQLPVQLVFVRSEGPCLSSAYKLVKDTNLIAIKEHQKHFFLANCIVQEKPSLVPTVIMMEPDLSVCYLKGRTSMTEEVFGQYVANMRKCLETGSKYDRTCGCPEIVDVYSDEMGVDDGAIGISKSQKKVLVPDEAFPSKKNIKPLQVPTRIPVEKPTVKPAEAEQSKDNNCKSMPRKTMKKKKISISFPWKKLLEKTPSMQTTVASYLPSCYEELSYTNQNDDAYDIIDVASLTNAQRKQRADEIVAKDVLYENRNKDCSTLDPQQLDCKKEECGSTLHAFNVKHLTIEEVSQCLSLLSLDQFIGSFKKEKLDGTILSELNEDVLKCDYGFSFTQAIRLMKFIREGHVSK